MQGLKCNLRSKKLRRTNQRYHFLEGSFINRDNATAAIQFRRERQPWYLKNDFFSRTHPSTFTSIAPVSNPLVSVSKAPLKRIKMTFIRIEINKPLPAPVYSVSWIRFKSVPHLDVFWYRLNGTAPKKCTQKSSCHTFSIYISRKN